MTTAPIYVTSSIDWKTFSKNPNAIHIIEQHLNKICWETFSENTHPNAIRLLEQNLHKVCWKAFSANPGAVSILKKNLDKVRWGALCLNPSSEAIQLLEQHPSHISWELLAGNPNPDAIRLFEKDFDKFSKMYKFINGIWVRLSANPNAVHLLKRAVHNIVWSQLCKNPNPEAITILKEHPEKINWESLSQNPEAIDMLLQNEDKINIKMFTLNPHPKAIQWIQHTRLKNQWKQPYSYYGQLLAYNSNLQSIRLIEEHLSIEPRDMFMYLNGLLKNPNAIHLIAPLNYKQMQFNNQPFAQELVSFVCHPNWINKCAMRLNLDMMEYQELLMTNGVF